MYLNDSEEQRLIALPILGDSLAREIAEERALSPFVTWEELSKRVSKLNATTVTKLKKDDGVRLSSSEFSSCKEAWNHDYCVREPKKSTHCCSYWLKYWFRIQCHSA